MADLNLGKKNEGIVPGQCAKTDRVKKVIGGE